MVGGAGDTTDRLALSVPEALCKYAGDNGDSPRAILWALVSRTASDDTEPNRQRKSTNRKDDLDDVKAMT